MWAVPVSSEDSKWTIAPVEGVTNEDRAEKEMDVDGQMVVMVNRI